MTTARRFAFVTWAPVACVVLAGVALLGWAVDSQALAGYGFLDRPMKANSAVAVVGLAAAVLAAARGHGRIARVLAGAVAAFGLITVAEYVFDWDAGIDELLFSSARSRALGVEQSRTALPVAVSLVLLGAVVAAGRAVVADRRAMTAAGVSALLGLAGVLGRLFDAPLGSTLGIERFATFSAPTGLAIILLAGAVVALEPDRGLPVLLRAPGPAGQIARRLLPAAVIATIGLAWLRLKGQEQGWYGSREGLTLLTTALVAAIGGLVVFAAARLQHAERMQIVSAQREAALRDAALDAFITLDVEGRVVDFNRSAERMLARRAAAVAGLPIDMLIVPGRFAEPGVEPLAQRLVARAGGGELFELDVTRGDGATFRAEVAIDRLPADGAAVYVLSLRDITQRVDRERMVRRLASIVDASPDAIVSMTLDGVVRSWNPAAERMYGWTAEEMVGREMLPLTVPPDRLDHGRAVFAKLREMSAPMTGRSVHVRRDGSRFPVALQLVPGSDPGGERGVSLVLTDVTERVTREQELARLAAVVESSQDAIYTIDADGIVRSWNEAAARMFGYAADELLGRDVAILRADDEGAAERARGLVERLARGEAISAESIARHKDGTQIDVLYSAFPIHHDERALGAGVIARDITERRRLELQLRQSEKMEAVGQLAGGIAHDFNNLLTVISGYGAIARRRIGAGPGAPELEEIETAADRGTALTRQLLAFSRRQVLEPRPVDLRGVVDDLMPMLGRLIGESVEVAVRAHPRPTTVLADRGQIEQVVINLAINARDAMKAGGTLTIETGFTAGGEVRLTITDTGTGMDAATRDRIFEPFFTTKAVGEGTGLGLATVHGVVTALHGRIEVSSELGFGTTFELCFPATDVPAEVPIAPDADDADVVGGGDETVLVCEDERAVRIMLVRILSAEGYHVLAAATPEEALRIAHGDQRIDVLVSDVIMPGMNGLELLTRLSERRPRLPTLFLSGYTAQTIEESGLPDHAAFLQKPFKGAALLRVLRDLLTGAQRA